jgi:hypothetical protein
MESGDADLIIHEEVPSTPDEVREEMFQKMEEQPTIEELNCENGDSDDDNDIVSTEHVRPLPTHKDALQCVLRLITYSTAHQPQFIFFIYILVLRHSGLQLRCQEGRKKSVNILQ